MRKCIVFDRDGVLNEMVYRGEGVYTSPWTISELHYKEGALELVNLAREAGYLNFIVTNQPGVFDHHLTVEELVRINDTIKAWYRITDSRMALFPADKEYYKPGHAMITDLIHEYDVDPQQSFLVGDRYKDIVAGYNAGLTTIFLGQHYWAPKQYSTIHPNYMADNLIQVQNIIKNYEK